MAAPQIPADILEKFRKVNEKNYQDQAIFYLNAFWNEGAQAQAEEVWGLCEAFSKEDHVKGKNGNELNPIQAFNLLQKKNKTMTALELKALLRKVDYDSNGDLSLAEYLVGFNNHCPKAFVNNPQGSASPEEQAKLDAAEENMNALGLKFDELSALFVKAQQAEEEVKKLTQEAKEIQDEIKKQEDAKAAEIARLEALSTDQTVGIVKRNMAVQQLASAKNEDPLPLRKAKLTQDACVRRLEKATKAAEEATAAAQAKADECAKAIKEAEEELEALKRTCAGIPHGKMWFMERELIEKKKYLPQSRQ